jgi:hypothetical protein
LYFLCFKEISQNRILALLFVHGEWWYRGFYSNVNRFWCYWHHVSFRYRNCVNSICLIQAVLLSERRWQTSKGEQFTSN